MKKALKISMLAVALALVGTACNEKEDELRIEDSVILMHEAQMTNPTDNDKGGLKGDDD